MCDASIAVSGGTYDEYSDWESARIVRVRRPRSCEICCAAIPAGHYASVRVYGTDGSARSDYMHLACRSLWERVSDDGRQEIYHQETLDWIENDIDPALADTHRAIVRWSHGGPWVPVEVGDLDES